MFCWIGLSILAAQRERCLFRLFGKTYFYQNLMKHRSVSVPVLTLGIFDFDQAPAFLPDLPLGGHSAK